MTLDAKQLVLFARTSGRPGAVGCCRGEGARRHRGGDGRTLPAGLPGVPELSAPQGKGALRGGAGHGEEPEGETGGGQQQVMAHKRNANILKE